MTCKTMTLSQPCKDDVPWHKSDLHSCFGTRVKEGSDTRGFKAGDHSQADWCSQCSRHTTWTLPAGARQSLRMSTPFQLPLTVGSAWKSRLICSAKQKCRANIIKTVLASNNLPLVDLKETKMCVCCPQPFRNKAQHSFFNC